MPLNTNKVRTNRDLATSEKIIFSLIREKYQGKRTEDIFEGKDPTAYFRDLRDSTSKKRTV